MKGHIDKQKFVGVLKDEGFVDEDEEFEDEDIVHTYGRLDEENMWRTRETPKEGYELVTIYDCY
jgi:predicted Rossmann-fold nucleotide-binding protein